MATTASAKKARRWPRSTGSDILQGDWDAAHKQEIDRIRQQMPTLDAKLLESPAARYGDARAHGARPRARGGRCEIQAGHQRPAAGARAAAKRNDRIVARARRQAGHGALSAAGGCAGHDARDVRSQRSGRPVRAPGARRRGRHHLRDAGAGRISRSTRSSKSAKCRWRASPGRLRRPRSSPRTPSWRPSTRATRRMFQAPEQANIEYLVLDLDTVKKGIDRERAGSQDLLRAERGALSAARKNDAPATS